jgi:hypothetical protein
MHTLICDPTCYQQSGKVERGKSICSLLARLRALALQSLMLRDYENIRMQRYFIGRRQSAK